MNSELFSTFYSGLATALPVASLAEFSRVEAATGTWRLTRSMTSADLQVYASDSAALSLPIACAEDGSVVAVSDELNEALLSQPVTSALFDSTETRPGTLWLAPLALFGSSGAMVIGIRGEPNPLIQPLIDQVIENCFMNFQLLEQRQLYEGYLKEVTTIKEKLLPHDDHRVDGAEYAVYYNPNIGGGGDYFDVVDLRAARARRGIVSDSIFWGLSLVDVSGHGPGAAVEVAMIDAIMRTFNAEENSGPGDVIRYINQHYFTRQMRGGIVTGILCTYDSEKGQLTYANAGHLPILVKRSNGDLEVLENADGIPIGVNKDYQWISRSKEIAPGDFVILLTDGITEARSTKGEQFGFERVLDFLQTTRQTTAASMLDDFLGEFSSFLEQSEKNDDQTMIFVKVDG